MQQCQAAGDSDRVDHVKKQIKEKDPLAESIVTRAAADGGVVKNSPSKGFQDSDKISIRDGRRDKTNIKEAMYSNTKSSHVEECDVPDKGQQYDAATKHEGDGREDDPGDTTINIENSPYKGFQGSAKRGPEISFRDMKTNLRSRRKSH